MLLILIRNSFENNSKMAFDAYIIATVLIPFIFLNKRIPPFDRDDTSSSCLG